MRSNTTEISPATKKRKLAPHVSAFSGLKFISDLFKYSSNLPQRYPEIFTFNHLFNKVFVLQHADLIQYVFNKNHDNYIKDKGYEILGRFLGKGLVTNPDTANWRKQRNLIQPAFHRQSLYNISRVVTSCTEELLQSWKAREDTTFDFTTEVARLTITIVAKALFTTDVSDKDIQMVWHNVNHLNDLTVRLGRNPFQFTWKYIVPGFSKGEQKTEELNELIYSIIHKRKEQKDAPHDLLQMLIEARYEDTGLGMTDEQIRDEVMTIFIAGHETTVNALSWTWYLLKQHADSEEKLKQESRKFAFDRTPVLEDLPLMEFGKQIMNESMRLYPPVPFIGRIAINDDIVGGYQIKSNNIVAVNIVGVHHNPAHWQNPFEFNPERFKNFELKGDNRFKFMPFGAGPRICIGNNFAMMEMQLINSMLSARVEMDLISNDVIPISLVTLKPNKPIFIHLKKVVTK